MSDGKDIDQLVKQTQQLTIDATRMNMNSTEEELEERMIRYIINHFRVYGRAVKMHDLHRRYHAHIKELTGKSVKNFIIDLVEANSEVLDLHQSGSFVNSAYSGLAKVKPSLYVLPLTVRKAAIEAVLDARTQGDMEAQALSVELWVARALDNICGLKVRKDAPAPAPKPE